MKEEQLDWVEELAKEVQEDKGHLLVNKIKTPDGTILESHYRHDYKSHKDSNSKNYSVDGGLSYCKGTYGEDVEDLRVYSTDTHEKIRENLKWGTYGKCGTKPPKRILLKDLSNEHIKAILDDVGIMPWLLKKHFLDELDYRNGLGIVVEDTYG
jgi:hypothetical protein